MHIIKFLMGRKKILFASFALGTVSSLITIWILSEINRYLSSLSEMTRSEYGLLIGACLALGILGFFSKWIVSFISARFVHDMRMQLTNSILRYPYSKLEKYGNEKIYSSLTTDIDISAAAFAAVPGVFLSGSMVLIAGGYLFLLSSTYFIYFSVILTLIFLVVFALISFSDSLFAKSRRQQDVVYKHYQTLVNGIKELKINGLRQYQLYEEDLKSSSDAYSKKLTTAYAMSSVVDQFAKIALFVYILTMLFFATKGAAIQPEIIISYVTTVIFLTDALGGLLAVIGILIRGNIALGRVQSFELSDDVLIVKQNKPAVRSSVDAVNFERAVFSYSDDEESFKFGPVDLSFKSGSVTFVVGGNGSGKSTFVKLLTGLYLPHSGSVSYVQKSGKSISLSDFQNRISVIYPDYHLFERINYGCNNLSASNAQSLLEHFRLSKKVEIVDGKWSTIDLSTGQKKRLALIAAILEDKDVYIFDEWAADQDPDFKKVFYRNIIPSLKAKGKIVIAITHDDSYFDLADEVVTFDSGLIKRASEHDVKPVAQYAALID